MPDPGSLLRPDGTTIVDLDRIVLGSLEDLWAIERRSVVSIGVVRGRCAGFALAAALAVDLVVAAPTATFGDPGPWTPLVLRRGAGIAGRRVAGYLAMTGRSVSAERALRWGIASHLADDPDSLARELAAGIDGRSVVAVRTILRQAHRGASADHADVRASGPTVAR